MRNFDSAAIRGMRDRECALVKTLYQHAVTAPVIKQNLQLITAPSAEHIQVPALRITRQLLAHHCHQTCDLSAHIAGAGVEKNANLPIEPDHRTPSTACSHGAIAAASHLPANVTTRPFGKLTSTRGSVASSWAGASSRTATGTKPPLLGLTCGPRRSSSFARQ